MYTVAVCLQSKGWSSCCMKAALSITTSVNDCKQNLKREISGVSLCSLEQEWISGLFLAPDWVQEQVGGVSRYDDVGFRWQSRWLNPVGQCHDVIQLSINGTCSITYCYHVESFSWITNMHNNIGQQEHPDKSISLNAGKMQHLWSVGC